MTHEYGDPISPEALEAAAERALELCQAAPGVSLEVHVAQAAKEIVCACVLDIEDDIEGGLSGTHTAVLAELSRHVLARLADKQHEADEAAVDAASDQSFPASDAPAWISRRHAKD